jgi:hypothetical protein
MHTRYSYSQQLGSGDPRGTLHKAEEFQFVPYQLIGTTLAGKAWLPCRVARVHSQWWKLVRPRAEDKLTLDLMIKVLTGMLLQDLGPIFGFADRVVSTDFGLVRFLGTWSLGEVLTPYRTLC